LVNHGFPGEVSLSPKEKILLSIVGIRGRGYAVLMSFAAGPDCEVASLADVATP